MEESPIQIFFDNKNTKCQNTECGHIMDAHLNFKKLEM